MTKTSLHSELCALFIAASAACAERVRLLDIAPVTQVSQDYVKWNEEGTGWQSASRSVEKNILADRNFPLFHLAPLLTPDVVEMATQCAEKLIRFPGVNLPFYSPWNYNHNWILTHDLSDIGPAIPEYEESPEQWTLGHLILRALFDHLRQLPSLDLASPEAANRFSEAVIEFAQSNNLAYKVTIPLSGISIAASRRDGLHSGSLRVHPLSPEDQGDLLESWGIGTQNMFLDLPRVVLSLTVNSGRVEQAPDPRRAINAWLCSFYLHGYSLAGREARVGLSPRWAGVGISSFPLKMLEISRDDRRLTPAILGKVQETVEKLQKYKIDEPTSAHELALHRFYLGAARQSSADAVVDFVVSLESLLLPYDSDTRHAELSYRFRMHGAHYLAKKKSERPEIVKKLNKLYGLRSNLVHGGRYPTPSAVEEGKRIAADLARVGLLRAVDEGFPGPDAFNRMLLGA